MNKNCNAESFLQSILYKEGASLCTSHSRSRHSLPVQISSQQTVLVTRSLLELGIKGPSNIFFTLELVNLTISNAVLVAV